MALLTGRKKPPLDSAALREAVGDADLRVLLMCLYHWTGERRWLEAPFRPTRDVRLIADPGAGLPAAVQATIRQTVITLLCEGDQLIEPAIDDPGEAGIHEMMSVCLGETVPPDYAPLIREDMGFVSGDPTWSAGAPPEAREALRCLIVGAGISGLALGRKLEQLGIPYTIVEKNAEVGGTWYENHYPGCGVDTPNHAYSYSGAPNPWPHYFSARDEILAYLKRCASHFGVRPRIRFETELLGARWDEARRSWMTRLRGPDGALETIEAQVLVSAIGQLNLPQLPELAGAADFGGPIFHTARWPQAHSTINIKGRRVAVLGTGASAMQLAPGIVDEVERLTIYQRSPQWARPIGEYHRAVSAGTQWLLDHLPYYAKWFRFTLFWRFGDGLLPFIQKDPNWRHPERAVSRGNDRHRQELSRFIRKELATRPELIEKCLPGYPPYGKRMLIDNGWFRMLLRPEVELVTEGISHLEHGAIVTRDGKRRAADVLVLATGFRVTDLSARLGIHGRGGVSLRDAWADDNPTAHLGINVPGFPNLFCMYGPNTNLGHGGSLIFHGECQARYISDCLVKMIEGGIAAVDCRRAVHDAWQKRVDEAHEKMIWTHPGMSTWYRNRHGRVVSTSPWRLVDYWAMTHEAKLEDFALTGR